jgi:hypothetical protein
VRSISNRDISGSAGLSANTAVAKANMGMSIFMNALDTVDHTVGLL